MRENCTKMGAKRGKKVKVADEKERKHRRGARVTSFSRVIRSRKASSEGGKL